MEPFSGMRDILLGFDTDLHFENGDVMVTSGIDFMKREIFKVLITHQGDWKLAPSVGGSPEKFIGEQNTREVADALRSYIHDGIREIIFPSQASIKVVPTDSSRVLCFIDILTVDQVILSVPLEFDYSSGFFKLKAADERTTKPRNSKHMRINDISDMKRPNKYWSRIRTQSGNRGVYA